MKRGVKVLLCGLLLSVMAGTSWAAYILDQDVETDATTWWPYQPDYWNGQSFTPTLPYLTAVEMYFYPRVSTTGTFTVELWRHNGGAGTYEDPRLGTAPLASATVTLLSTGAQPDCWVRWQFNEPVDISAYVNSVAQPLMFVWTTPDIGEAVVYSTMNPYANGMRYWISGSGSSLSWARYNTCDFYFRTYGDTVPEPVTLALVLLGVAGLRRRIG